MERSSFSQQAKRSLSDQAYEYLRDQIIYLQFEPGQMVYENELAQTMGMSRTPLREAFSMLAVEGLIEVLPQRGVRISLVAESKIEEARFVRESLEISAFRQIAEQWKVTDPGTHTLDRAIQRLVEDQVVAAQANHAKDFLQADEAFHSILLQKFGNQTLLSVIGHMRGHLNRVRYLLLREKGDQMEVLVQEHKQLYAAIKSNDISTTVRILEQHLKKLHHKLPLLREQFPHYFAKK